MDTIRNNRVPAAILGVLLLVIFVVALTSLGGGDGDPALDSVQLSPTAEPTERSTPPLETSHPSPTDVQKLNCGPLISVEEEGDALGVWDRPPAERSTVESAGGEICLTTLDVDDRVFVQIGPGDPDDFLPEATMLGVTPEPVEGIGRLANWFGGPGAEGGGSKGVLSVLTETPFGFLAFRVSLGRPDLDSDGQREIAESVARAALQRFPGVAPPPRVLEPPEPADRAAYGYVQNLAAREADGEWTYEEGLIATLRLLTGEADAREVLRDPALLDFSTEIISRSREYLEAGADADVRAEIASLLETLVQPPPSNDADAGTGAGAPDGSVQRTALSLTQQPEQEKDCDPYYDTEVCWSGVDIDPQRYGGIYRLRGPQSGWGWTPEHVNLIERAMITTIGTLHDLGIPPPPTDLLMTPQPGIGGIDRTLDTCLPMVGVGFQAIAARSEKQAEQAVAALLAECSLEFDRFPEGSLAHEAWTIAGAWFLSDLVYPDADLEEFWGLPAELAELELTTPMLDYGEHNWAFLEEVQSVDVVLSLLSTSAEELAAFPGIDALVHRYARGLTEGRVADLGGAHAYRSPTRHESLTAPGRVIAIISAFQPVRVEASVEGGDYACVSYSQSGSPRASWSPGPSGAASSWSDRLPDVIDGVSVFVATALTDSQLTIEVVRFVDDPDDCDDPVPPDSRLPDSGDGCGSLCGPSGFFWHEIKIEIPEEGVLYN